MSDAGVSLDTGLKILEIGSILGGGLLVMFKMGQMTAKFEVLIRGQGAEITELKANVIAMREVITNVAVQKSRLDNQADRMGQIERRLEEMRHGQGYIADGEYSRIGRTREGSES